MKLVVLNQSINLETHAKSFLKSMKPVVLNQSINQSRDPCKIFSKINEAGSRKSINQSRDPCKIFSKINETGSPKSINQLAQFKTTKVPRVRIFSDRHDLFGHGCIRTFQLTGHFFCFLLSRFFSPKI